MVELLIQNGDTIYAPAVEDGIEVEWERKGTPGKLTFSIIKDELLNIVEGNPVRLRFGDTKVFYGFIFTLKRDKGDSIKVIAYDQLRYLKNKDTYVYSNKKASNVVRMLAEDFRLQVGQIDDTGFVIASRVEDNKTLFDIIHTAMDLTLQSTGRLYVLYDDFGQLTLKNIENMKLNLLVDEETGENFDYTSTIDGETYNKIKLAYNNKDTGKREIYLSQDSAHMNDWGVLQYSETIDENVNGKAKADALLSLYNQKTRNLSISGALGDIRVRAGSSVVVKLNLGDMSLQHFMLVEKVKHKFQQGHHTMNLTLRGGEFVG